MLNATVYSYLRSMMHYDTISQAGYRSEHHVRSDDGRQIIILSTLRRSRRTLSSQEGGAPALRRIPYDSSLLSHRIPQNWWANRISPEWNSISSLVRLARHRHDQTSFIHHYFIILFVYHLASLEPLSRMKFLVNQFQLLIFGESLHCLPKKLLNPKKLSFSPLAKASSSYLRQHWIKRQEHKNYFF